MQVKQLKTFSLTNNKTTLKKIDFAKKLQGLKDVRETKERKGLRYKKLIAETVKEILKTNNPKLTNNSISQIALLVYKKNDRISTSRVKSMLGQEVVKKDINSELQRILTDKGIEPLLKSVDLLQKGEEVAKSTSDYVSLSRMYKDFAVIDQPKAHETREFESFAALKDNKPSKITQTLTDNDKTLKLVVKSNDENVPKQGTSEE